MRLMRHFAPGMAERGWGRIVNVTSTAGKRPSQTWPAYSVAKAGAALALAPVRRPLGARRRARQRRRPRPDAPRRCGWTPAGSPTRWPSATGSRATRRVARHAEKVPIGRFGEEEEVAAVVAFLCSERASNVAGAAWSADGGTFQSMI